MTCFTFVYIYQTCDSVSTQGQTLSKELKIRRRAQLSIFDDRTLRPVFDIVMKHCKCVEF